MTITTKLSCLLVLISLSTSAATTGINTTQTVTAAPSIINLSVTSPSEGNSLAHARANHVHGVTGQLAEGNGGTGAGALTCTNQFLTSNGTLYSCVTPTLAGPQFAGQGTGLQVLHGGGIGNPSWSAVNLSFPGGDVTGTLAEINGGTGASTLTCTNQFLTSNGTLYSCVTATLASAQFANQGTTSQVLIGNAAGNPSWGVLPAAANNVQTNASLTGTGTAGSPLGINLTNANTWTVIQTFTPSGAGTAVSATGGSSSGVAGVFTGGSPNGQAITATGTGTGNGGTVTGGSPAAGSNGGVGLVVNAGTTNSSSNGLAGGFGAQVSGTNGTASTTAAGTGGTGGYAVRGTTGNGGNGNTSGTGGSGGDVYVVGTIGVGGQGGTSGNGGSGGRVLLAVGGDGGPGGIGSGNGGGGSGGVTSAAVDITAGAGGTTGSGLGTGGVGGNAGKFQGGAGGTTSGAGTGGAGGIGSISIGGNGGGTSGGTFGGGGIGASVTGGNAGGSGANGGIGEVLTGGNSSGTGINGTGLSVGSGTGGSGTGGGGLVIAMTQNNTVRAHANLNPLTSAPSTKVNGDIWVRGATTAMVFESQLNSTTQAFVTQGSNGAGALQAGTVAGCATAASLNATCDVTVTWTTAWPDTNYKPVCTGLGVTSGVPAPMAMITLANASVTFRTVSLTAAAAQFTSVYCLSQHN